MPRATWFTFDRILSTVLTVAAVVIAASVAKQVFLRPPPTATNLAPVYVSDWERLLSAGIYVAGDPTAAVKLIEFVDFQCPACRAVEPRLREFEARHVGAVARVLVHFPLPMHPAALPAARAVECADLEGKAGAMVEALYAHQDSIVRRGWLALSQDAGVADPEAMAACIEGPLPFTRIDEGLALATTHGIHSTPTVIINGWQFMGGPPDNVLDETLEDLLSGKVPRSSKARWWRGRS